MKYALKGQLALGIATAMLFACSYSKSPRSANKVNNDSSSSIAPINGEGKERFLSSFSSSVKGGINLTFQEGSKLYFDKVSLDSANTIDLSGTSLDFALDSLNLHAINFALDGEIDYNDSTAGVSLFCSSDTLLMKARLASDGSCLKYKLDLSESILDGSNGKETSYDSETNGYYCYQFGDFSWILDEISDILDGFAVPNSGKEITISWSAVASSLNSIKETSVDGLPYFTWNLQLEEDGPIYPLGLRGDSSYAFKGIDLPAKTSGESSLSFNEEKTLRANLSLDVNGKSKTSSWDLPSEAEEYAALKDSSALIKKIGSTVKNAKFGIDGNVVLTHEEGEVPTTSTTFGHDAISEKLTLDLGADIDFNGGKIQEVGADVTFSMEKDSSTKSNTIRLRAFGAEGDNANDIYFSLNDALKARTTKPVFDQFYSNIQEMLGGSSVDSNDFGGFASTAESIKKAIEAYQNGAMNQGLINGKYDFILKAISSLSQDSNYVKIVLDMTQLGFASGTAIVELSGNGSLAKVTLSNLALGPFGIEKAEIAIRDYSMEAFSNASSYETWTHLPTLGDQVKDLVNSSRAKFNFSGYLFKEGTTTVADHSGYSRNEQGFVFSGDFAFDLDAKKGAGKATFTDRQEKYINDHNIQIEVTGPMSIDSATNLDTNSMNFHYDSKNNSSVSDENRTDPNSSSGMNGYFSIHSLNDILHVAQSFLTSDDPRFERLLNLFMEMSTTSLVGKMSNGLFFDASTSDIVDSFVTNGDKDVLTLSKSVIGTSEPIVISLNYDNSAVSDSSGPLKSLEISTSLGEGGSKKDLYLQLDILSLDCEDSDLSLFSDTSSFTNYSSVSSLLSTIIDTASLGVSSSNTVTTYHLSLEAKASLLGFSVKPTAEAFIRLDGADVSVFVKTHINYFLGVTNNETYSELYYHSSAADPDGDIMLRRAIYNRGVLGIGASWKQESNVKVKSSDFMSNILSWILGYMLNMTSTITGSIESSGDASSKCVHPEDVLTSYSGPSEATSVDNPEYNLGLDVGAIANSSVSMSLVASLFGDYVTIDGAKKDVLAKASGTLKISVLITISATFNATINNVSNHTYSMCWDDTSSYRNGKNNVSSTVSSLYSSLYGSENSEGRFQYSDTFKAISSYTVKPS